MTRQHQRLANDLLSDLSRTDTWLDDQMRDPVAQRVAIVAMKAQKALIGVLLRIERVLRDN